MKLKTQYVCMAMGIALLLTAGQTFGQADALVDMLQKKGLLTTREANEVKDQMMGDIRDQMPGTKMAIGSWLDELRISGDARIRYEKFFSRQSPTGLATFDEVERTRYRYRLRLALAAKAGDFTAMVRLASGDPYTIGTANTTTANTADAISTNTSFDQFASKKPVNIDMAYIIYQPSQFPGLAFTGGKMESPFWESDMVYDADLTPEGFAEQYTYKFSDEFSLTANLGQWVLAEDNTTANNGVVSRGSDSYMLGWQAGYSYKIVPKQWEVRQAVAYYDYQHIQDQANTLLNTYNGVVNRNSLKTTSTGIISWAKDYNVLSFNNELAIGVFPKLPITLMGEYIDNLATDEFDTGYKVGVKLWNAKTKGQYEIGYWYESLEADATLSLFSDSDFGSGGTNAKGHIIKAKYNLTDYVSLGFAYWNVENIDDFVRVNSTTDVGAGTAGNNQRRVDNRLQVDVVMKF
jgi:hypothetical protein